MLSSEPPVPRQRGRDELLEHIYHEGDRRRARRRTVTLAGVVAALLLLAGSTVAFQHDGQREQQVASGGAAPTTGLTPPTLPTTTAEPFPTVVASTPSTTARPSPITTATVGSTTTTTLLECRNSTDRACGEFRWDPPPPPNQPLTIAATPTVNGRTLTLRVVTSDPDANVKSGCASVDFGDGTEPAARACAVVACLEVFGPWTPPAPQPSEEEQVHTHTYEKPGTYTVTIRASTAQGCYDPYYSHGEKALDVVIV